MRTFTRERGVVKMGNPGGVCSLLHAGHPKSICSACICLYYSRKSKLSGSTWRSSKLTSMIVEEIFHGNDGRWLWLGKPASSNFIARRSIYTVSTLYFSILVYFPSLGFLSGHLWAHRKWPEQVYLFEFWNLPLLCHESLAFGV